ncbi:MarR family winged helix-turn-helix transcriptional regulator [Sulfuracidifex metallicus]|nr:MarR family transcriptional regulator [Sulfuracidifex metallicus]WOE51767.1 MarR family transcriptional regulator [Sulfuracidifex metallicus DSM 6482 = JCM 9184]
MNVSNNVDITLMSSIAKIHRAFQRELNRRLGSLNITYLDFLILKATMEGETTMAKLAKRFFVTQSAITAAVDRLEEMKLVCRGRSSDDRRIITVKITDDGVKVFEEGMTIYKSLAEDILRDFNDKENLLKFLIQLLERLETFEIKQ